MKCNCCDAENKDECNFCHDCGTNLNESVVNSSSKKNLIERFRNADVIIKIIFFGMWLESYNEYDAIYL